MIEAATYILDEHNPSLGWSEVHGWLNKRDMAQHLIDRRLNTNLGKLEEWRIWYCIDHLNTPVIDDWSDGQWSGQSSSVLRASERITASTWRVVVLESSGLSQAARFDHLSQS